LSSWARQVPGGWLFTVHAQPGAKQTQVAGPYGDALRIRVAAPPIEGRANDELIAFLAEVLGVPKRCVRVVKGASSRRKAVLVADLQADPVLLLKRED
jgi:uncharacterized protein (TIGR00251 family)